MVAPNRMPPPICKRCGKELTRPGALLFSDPDGDNVLKYHLCKHCWLMLVGWLHKGSAGSPSLASTPLYAHDCDGCIYLGSQYKDDGTGIYDAWVHFRHYERYQYADLTRRYSNEPSDYGCMSVRRDEEPHPAYKWIHEMALTVWPEEAK